MSDPKPEKQSEGQVGLEPDKALAPTLKDTNTKVTEAPTGALFDSVGHHCCGTSRYDEYARAASDVIRLQADIVRCKNADVPTYAAVYDIRYLLDENTNRIFEKYEAYSVEALSITLHDPGNAIMRGGHVFVCTCLDPDRDMSNDFEALENLRTHDCQLAEFNGQQGMNYIYDVPLNKAKFYTTPCADSRRLASPGQIAVMVRWKGSQYPGADATKEGVTPYLMTVTARVDFYCSTLRSDINVRILPGGPDSFPLDIKESWTPGIEQPLSNKLIFFFRTNNYPADYRGDCDVYFVKPIPYSLDIKLAVSETAEEEVVFNGFISMAHYDHAKDRMEVDISPLLNSYVGSDLSLTKLNVDNADFSFYVVYAPSEEINILKGNIELWI